jgi:Ni,Fe-hydrogenase III small subunit/ferredoxin
VTAMTKRTHDRHDILGDHVETDMRSLEEPRSTPAFRGDVAFAPGAEAQPFDPELWARLEEACAPRAIVSAKKDGRPELTLDRGRCITCGICQELAPSLFSVESGMARPARRRSEMVIARLPARDGSTALASTEDVGKQLSDKIARTLGRSLSVREVDAGSCNGCEVEVAALNNPVYDVERFGVNFVASPRHADVLLVTGVGSRNMESALRRTYEATPDPKVVVAVGACACSGGIFGDTYATSGGIGDIVPVDVFVPGCPPRPEALLYGLLLAVDRVK